MKKLIFLVIFIAVVLLGLNTTKELYLSKTLKLSEPVLIEVPKGASLTSVASQLASQNLIDYPRLFVKIGQFSEGASVKYGEYELTPNDTYRQVLQKLTSGENYKYRITFVEGDHMYKYAQQVEESGLGTSQEFLRFAKDKGFVKDLLGEEQNSLEGYLFPDTYSFSKIDGVKKIVETMVNKFLSETKDIIPNNGPMNRHQIVTLASIVEKETGAAFERPVISSVFHNRMRKNMRLQTDPTIIYGILEETGVEINNIRIKDIKNPTAYNTYVINGLPPGPIANPGIESIQAAIRPKKTPYFYFVSQNDGTHIFTETYKDHQKAVNRYQKNPKMREGKSWRDLKTRTQ